jgi:predicted acyl esterase
MKSVLGRLPTPFAVVVIAVAALGYQQAGLAQSAGYTHNSSLYVAAGDGTRIAVDVWLPEGLRPGQRIPALVKGTPYWRAR